MKITRRIVFIHAHTDTATQPSAICQVVSQPNTHFYGSLQWHIYAIDVHIEAYVCACWVCVLVFHRYILMIFWYFTLLSLNSNMRVLVWAFIVRTHCWLSKALCESWHRVTVGFNVLVVVFVLSIFTLEIRTRNERERERERVRLKVSQSAEFMHKSHKTWHP